jgi:hypothetical protein
MASLKMAWISGFWDTIGGFLLNLLILQCPVCGKFGSRFAQNL